MASPGWTVRTTVVLAGTLLIASAAEAQERTPVNVQPGAPGEESRVLGAEDLRPPERDPHTPADVLFMQNMILHHEQALIMARKVPERSARDDVRLLAERIERAQMDEIAVMARWLELRGEEVPPLGIELDASDELPGGALRHGHQQDHDHRHHEHDMMAGMLTDEELATLEAARGEEFDRLFLEFMIYHHEGAVLMVEELMASPGAARASDVFELSTHVANDQQDEIARMRTMLARGS